MLTIRKILVLSKLPLFHDMKPEILADLAQITLEKVYPKSENIFEKGDEGSSLYIIVEGAVRIHDASDANKASKTLAVLKEGEFFGELSILDNETRSASATAQDYSILLEIGQHSFQRLCLLVRIKVKVSNLERSGTLERREETFFALIKTSARFLRAHFRNSLGFVLTAIFRT